MPCTGTHATASPLNCVFSLPCPFHSYSFPLSVLYSSFPLSKLVLLIFSPPSRFIFFTYLFLFSYLKGEHKAQETGPQPAFKSLFNPLSEISSILVGQRKQSNQPCGTTSLLCKPTTPVTSCSESQHGAYRLMAGSSFTGVYCFSEAKIM